MLPAPIWLTSLLAVGQCISQPVSAEVSGAHMREPPCVDTVLLSCSLPCLSD